MSAFVLKIIAIITMFIDHIGYVINDGNFSYFNYIGRIAFPIFAFQISEGYIHTKNLKRYFFRLFLFAIISQIPFMLFDSIITNKITLNIFFTLILGLTCIYIYDISDYKILGIIYWIAIGIIAQIAHFDYGFYGVSIILIFYIFKNNSILSFLFFTVANAIKYILPITKLKFYKEYLLCFLFVTISYFIIALYNGKKGKDTKYLLYLFYPIHLLIIYGIYLFLKF